MIKIIFLNHFDYINNIYIISENEFNFIFEKNFHLNIFLIFIN